MDVCSHFIHFVLHMIWLQEFGDDAFDEDDNVEHELDDDTIDELGEEDDSEDGYAVADSDVDEGSMVGFNHQAALVGTGSTTHAAAGGVVSALHQRRNAGSPLRRVAVPGAGSDLKQAGSLNED